MVIGLLFNFVKNEWKVTWRDGCFCIRGGR